MPTGDGDAPAAPPCGAHLLCLAPITAGLKGGGGGGEGGLTSQGRDRLGLLEGAPLLSRAVRRAALGH